MKPLRLAVGAEYSLPPAERREPVDPRTGRRDVTAVTAHMLRRKRLERKTPTCVAGQLPTSCAEEPNFSAVRIESPSQTMKLKVKLKRVNSEPPVISVPTDTF